MIRLKVERPSDKVFKAWEKKAEEATRQLISRWNYACGSQLSIRKFLDDSNRISRSIYSSGSLKELIRKSYLRKCAFCERRVRRRDGDVEHFRPKSRVKTKIDSREQDVKIDLLIGEESVSVRHPGYFWLAYSWENLLLACSGCNQRLKRCLFPLRDEAMRAKSPGQELSEEELLIHPGHISEDLTKHFSVHKNGVLIALTERAESCVEIFDLNRDEDLLEERRKQFKSLQKVAREHFCATRVPGFAESRDLAELETTLNETSTGSLEYAAVGRAAILDWRRELDASYKSYCCQLEE